MDKIEIGEYIRTKRGTIHKIVAYSDLVVYTNDKDKSIFENYEVSNGVSIADISIKSHSKNLIDLIEVGDIVNGYRVDFIDELNVLVNSSRGLDKSGFRVPIAQYSDQIKTILTKEQYEQNCYKVQ